MAFNGSGVFQRLYNWVNDAAANIKIRADRMDAEMDGFASGLSNCVTKDGQTAITATLPMSTYRHTNVGLANARTEYARFDQLQDGVVNWAAATGTADAITVNYSIALTALIDGQICYVRAGFANATTTPSFSPNGLTARIIVKQGGSALEIGDISAAGHELVLRYDLTNTRWELLNPKAPAVVVPTEFSDATFRIQDDADDTKEAAFEASGITTATTRTFTFPDKSGTLATTDDTIVAYNAVSGLILSNDTDADHDINITAGQAADSSNVSYLTLASEMTKQIDATWAIGDDAGGLFSGSVAVDTTYHVFVIEKDSDGSIDAGFDTSVTAVNIPSGYTKYRRIGSVVTDGSSNIIGFKQRGNEFIFDTPILDISNGSTGTSANTGTMTTPSGVNVKVLLNTHVSANAAFVYFSSLDSDDLASSSSVAPLAQLGGASNQKAYVEVWTDTSNQIRYRSNSNTTVRAATLGYKDTRGK